VTCAASDADVRPVPWVPVETAPETVCSMMSPMLVSESPAAASVSLRCFRGVPAATVTVPPSRSNSRMPVSRSGRMSIPSVAAAAVKECPVPTALTCSPSSAARRTASASASVVEGETVRAGAVATLPAQFRHVVRVPRSLRAGRLLLRPLLVGCALIRPCPLSR
jgi:hypothetical protein